MAYPYLPFIYILIIIYRFLNSVSSRYIRAVIYSFFQLLLSKGFNYFPTSYINTCSVCNGGRLNRIKNIILSGNAFHSCI